jgi:hypothetical protein
VTTPLDLSTLSPEEARARLGELVAMCLSSRGAAVLLRRENGEITVVDPRVLDTANDEEMAAALVHSWTEAEIEGYFMARDSRRQS